MITDDEIYLLTTGNRLMIADLLETLDDKQWEAPTLSAGWTVRQIAAHFVQPMLIGFDWFFLISLRYRGNTDKTVDHFTRQIADSSPAELIALLRRHAADRVDPARVGPMGPFAETCIHLRDIARPLGLTIDVPIEHWRILLDYLTSPTVAPALVPAGRLDGLHLVATDTDWNSDSGANDGTGKSSDSASLVSGPIEALGMAATGRPAALADLHGPGVGLLAGRLRKP